MNDVSYQAGGPLPPASDAYIKRDADNQLLRFVGQMAYVQITEPRQQGKTSLIAQLHSAVEGSGCMLVYLDAESLRVTAEGPWYQDLAARLVARLRGNVCCDDLPTPVDPSSWRSFLLGLATALPVAAGVGQQLIIALDEVGSIPLEWAEGFFRVLREIYNSRIFEPNLRRLAFILMGAFDPRDLIRDSTISPFNVAHKINLPDFDLQQVRALVQLMNLPQTQAESVAERLHYWTGGQPYLTQKLCLSLSEREPDELNADVVDKAVDLLFEDDINHLPRISKDLGENPELLAYCRKIASRSVRFSPAVNPEHFRLAHVVGIITSDSQGYCCIRNRIYDRALRSLQDLTVPPTEAKSRADGPMVQGHSDSASSPKSSARLVQRITLEFVQAEAETRINWRLQELGIGRNVTRFTPPYGERVLPLVIRVLEALQYGGSSNTSHSFTPPEQRLLAEIGLWQNEDISRDAAQIIGHALYYGLDEKGKGILADVRTRAMDRAMDTAYILRFPPEAVMLAALPWELISAETGPLLINLGSSVNSCERYIDTEEPLPSPLAPGARPHLLALLPRYEIAPEAAESERTIRRAYWERLRDAGLITFDEISPLTRKALSDYMLGGNPQPDIVHYVGHGTYEHGKGYLLFDDSPGDADRVSAEELRVMLGGVRLLCIYGCNSAMVTQAGGLMSGVAPSLSVVMGAVVAMQLPVSMPVVVRFSQMLYQQLLEQHRSLQESVAIARQALFFDAGQQKSWYVPTLYLRSREQRSVFLLQ